MQFVRVTSTAALFLLFGTMVPVYAQRDQKNERQSRSEKQQDRQRERQQVQPRQQRVQQQRQQVQQRQRSQQAHQQRLPHRTQQQARSWQQQRGWLQRGGWQGQRTWQQGRARRWESEHRTWAQRGGYGGYYIPQDRFSVYFGSRNYFRIRSRPGMYMGYPRFYYGGFSFLMLDPWPEYWQEDWYATDDVYVDYDDGYYLYNRRHPGVRLAISVVF